MRINNRSLLIVAFGILLSFFYYHFFENRASVELDISVSERTWFKLYWAEEGQKFSEKRRARVRVYPEQNNYTFFLTDISNIDKLRIDPHQYPGSSALKSLTISQKNHRPIVFNSSESFKDLSIVFQVIKHEYQPDEGLITLSEGEDPAYLAHVEPEYQRSISSHVQMLVRIVVIILLVLILLIRADALLLSMDFIPVIMTAIFIQIIIMASISQPKVHPDEYVHFNASEYYVDNWLPPEIDSPDIRHTYSVYGVSRLNSHEVVYFFTGKFAKLIEPFKIADHLKYRLFNICLFGIILFMVFHSHVARLAALPFLLTPQIWYIFSYCNSDAFALTVSFICCHQLLHARSIFNSYLTAGKAKKLSSLFIVGLLGGLLLLTKKNFYFFFIFLGGYICWKLYFVVKEGHRQIFIKRIALVILVAVLFSAGRFGLDYYVNGPDRQQKISEARIKYSKPLYSPLTPLNEKHVFLYRKARGDDWKTLIFHDRWLEKVFRSAIGIYGYTSVIAGDDYYDVYRWVGLFSLLLFISFVVIRGDPRNSVLLSYFLVCSVGIILASFWHSWTADFQPQGRYLLPIVPMFSVVLYHAHRFLPAPFIAVSAMVFFLLSSYSFIFVGLWQIPKVAGL